MKTLLQDLLFSFIAPWLFYLLAANWFRFLGRLTPTTKKIILSTTVGFILYGLALTGIAESATLIEMWRRSPVAWSFVYLLFVGAVISAATQVLVQLWRRRAI